MSDDLGILGQAGPPWCLALEGTAQEVTGTGYAWAGAGLTVRVLRGRKMRTYQGLFDECGAALQFPWYFGENGNAFSECITDLSWLPPQAGYVFLITEPAEVLSATDDDGLPWLIQLLDEACGTWARPVQRGQPWDRPPVPFHVVLQAVRSDSGDAVPVWTAGGAAVFTLS
jgi:hypothetical protein